MGPGKVSAKCTVQTADTGSARATISALDAGVHWEREAPRRRCRNPVGNSRPVYWYDAMSGAWGYQGGPTAGFTLPGIRLGGMLRADASNGNTGVFINGRELHFQDVIGLRQFCQVVMPG